MKIGLAEMARIYPAISELDRVPATLTLGEWYVLNAVRALDNGWLVYVKPHLDGGQPDFVIANPLYGVCVVEVRDWSVGEFRQDFEGRLEMLSGNKWVRTTERPRAEVHRYRSELIKRFFDDAGSPSTKLHLVRAIVIMPRFRTGDARELLAIPQAGGRAEQSVDVWGGGMLKIALMAVITGREKPARRKVPPNGFDRMCRSLDHPEVGADHFVLIR